MNPINEPTSQVLANQIVEKNPLYQSWIQFNGFFWILYLLWFAGFFFPLVVYILLSIAIAYYAYLITGKLWWFFLGAIIFIPLGKIVSSSDSDPTITKLIALILNAMMPILAYIVLLVIFKKGRNKQKTPQIELKK